MTGYERPADPRAAELVDDCWRLTCGNLAARLRGGAGRVLQDFADPAPCVELSMVIDAWRDRVFAALMDPEVLNRWIASAATVDPRVGGAYSYG